MLKNLLNKALTKQEPSLDIQTQRTFELSTSTQTKDLKSKHLNNISEDLLSINQRNDDLLSKYCTLYNEGQNQYTIDPLNSKFLKKKQERQAHTKTTGKGWYNMKAPELTPEIEADLRAINLRHIIDPSRFYKKPDMQGLPKFFQLGTIEDNIIEGKKYRLGKNEVKNRLVEEFIEADKSKNYSRRKFKEIQQQKISLGKKKQKMNKYKLKNKKGKTEYMIK